MDSRHIKTGVVILLLGGLLAGIALLNAGDPVYRIREFLAFGRYSRFDSVIRETADRLQVDPCLVKAVVWRESGFVPDKTGTSGERGLMQVMEAAAEDWVQANHIETFQPTDLFSPQTNIEVGTWYLANAFERWKAADNALPYALAEYNAGRSRATRWGGGQKHETPIPAKEMLTAMDIPGTRRYIEAIRKRTEFYHRRNEFSVSNPGG